MHIPRLFKTPRHQRFGYVPMYYNEEKEKLAERIAEYNKEGGDREAMQSRISRQFRSKANSRGSGVTSSTRRVMYLRIVIMFVLIALTLLFLQVYLPRILELSS